METYLFEVGHLLFRYFHIVAGIAWIGASFYFVWLDNNLTTPPQWKKDKGIEGDLWAIHAGGIYEVAKYKAGPEKMPPHLHWFKWEAYSTWISGALLLSLLYYVGADVYLIDPSKAALEQMSAIALSIGCIGFGYLFYRLICKTPLLNNGLAFAAVALSFLTAWTWGIDHFFSDRAVYIHVGALIGTCMAGNVFNVIVPSQKQMVKAISEGKQPDPQFGLIAKQVSIHNNYATLPILFIMLSNHFAFTYAHQFGWLILIALFIVGMWIRHFFNLKNRGIYKPSVLISGIVAFFVVMLACAPWHTIKSKTELAQAAVEQVHVSDEQVWQIIQSRCTECHSQTPTSAMFKSPPAGFVLDNMAQAKQFAALINTRAVVTKDMPLANLTKMTDDERDLIALWVEHN
ncbi:urate hydroxylase PuuD [Catenovulum sp. 2E275]|uniref:urate hydroxylase PuuD n=1 Tax=Catenovulum sp. 2E275 TaxID=2980497 RepID=UPI0021D3D3DD|nr:urate hydroxylase PuuD [Catenovulum sp. 2E275]MCU4676033.1 urate hydroxylase PuuD [Catenovulum sp. 2E275]